MRGNGRIEMRHSHGGERRKGGMRPWKWSMSDVLSSKKNKNSELNEDGEQNRMRGNARAQPRR